MQKDNGMLNYFKLNYNRLSFFHNNKKHFIICLKKKKHIRRYFYQASVKPTKRKCFVAQAFQVNSHLLEPAFCSMINVPSPSWFYIIPPALATESSYLYLTMLGSCSNIVLKRESNLKHIF